MTMQDTTRGEAEPQGKKDKTEIITRATKDMGEAAKAALENERAPVAKTLIDAVSPLLEILLTDINRQACASERIADALEVQNQLTQILAAQTPPPPVEGK